jgi:hypothetical protein
LHIKPSCRRLMYLVFVEISNQASSSSQASPFTHRHIASLDELCHCVYFLVESFKRVLLYLFRKSTRVYFTYGFVDLAFPVKIPLPAS